ncbi:MAG: membrane-bound O-acyltransferase family protein [Leptospiraceae bacterium]|nr:MAG: membrane-bound O-acyltransferase family protein [Leptospiraceae bacterium]
MLFVTEEYLIFFIVVFLLFWTVLPKYRFFILLLSSIYFYGTWSIPFIFHLILIVSINYYGMELWRIYKKKFIFISVLIIDILNIAIFKYYYLFFDAIGTLLQIKSWQMPYLKEQLSLEGLKIFLPLGISFYTFQIMSYSYDIYSGKYDKKHSFKEVLLYILFFPQLIAGPIMRSEELLPQIKHINSIPVPKKEDLYYGFWLIMIGVFKKLIIADTLSSIVSPLFYNNLNQLTSIEIWIYVFTCLMMLYCDFSAYTDIARGCGKFLGFEIPINFKAPFFMHSMSDFWRRWHLTFSMWIRDYIYIPLGGSRVPEIRNYMNLIITFFLGGLWHGASYNFIIWGILVGIILSIEAFLFRRGIKEWPEDIIGKIVRIIISWYFMLTSALFFFVRDYERAKALLKKMVFFDFKLDVPENFTIIFYSFIGVMIFNYIEEYPNRLEKFKKYQFPVQIVFFILLLLMLIEYSAPGKDFFYFQF